jgi:lysine biosynthesis protein LysW
MIACLCPDCGKQLNIDEKDFGTLVICEECGCNYDSSMNELTPENLAAFYERQNDIDFIT